MDLLDGVAEHDKSHARVGKVHRATTRPRGTGRNRSPYRLACGYRMTYGLPVKSAAVADLCARCYPGTSTADDAETCRRCHRSNVIWFAPSPLWNLVMRGNNINGKARYGDLVCMPCFVDLAAEAGVTGVWRLTVDPEPDGLIFTTPSGRVWNPDTNRWDDPA